MADQDDLQILARAPLFSLLGRDALQLLSFAAERRSLAPGEVLFRRGDRADGGYVVAEGAVVLRRKADGAGAFVAEPGALIGQAALFVRQNRPATATAREASRVIRISPTLVRRVLEEYPAAARAVHRALAVDLLALAGDLEEVRRRLLAIDAGPDRGPAPEHGAPTDQSSRVAVTGT